MELREHDLSIQLKMKEIAVAKGASSPTGKLEKFDMSRQIRFVPPFQETEVDKYFLHLEKISSFKFGMAKGVVDTSITECFIG